MLNCFVSYWQHLQKIWLEKNENRIFQNLLLTGMSVNTENRDPKRCFRLHLFTRPEDCKRLFSLSFQKPFSSGYIHHYILKYNSRHLFEGVKQVFEGKKRLYTAFHCSSDHVRVGRVTYAIIGTLRPRVRN